MKRIALLLALFAPVAFGQATFQPIGPLGYQQSPLASAATITPYMAHVLYTGSGGGNLTLPLITTTGLEQVILIDNPSSGTLTLNTQSSQGTNGSVTTSVTVPANSMAIAESYLVSTTPYWSVITQGSGSTITGGTCTNQATTAISTAGVPTCTTLTSAYVNTSIAQTGVDINTSFQVTATHLGSALPLAQGGLGATSLAAANIATFTTSNPVSGHCPQFSGTTGLLVDSGAACGGGGGSGTVNSGTSGQLAYYGSTGTAVSGLTLSGNLVISSGSLITSQPLNAQAGTSYAFLSGDAGKLVTAANASSQAYTLPQAGTTGFGTGYSFDFQNVGASGNGIATITPTTSTIAGLSSLPVPPGTGCTASSDGTNYQPSACDALMLLFPETWKALQTFTNSDIALLGSSTGATTFTSANSSATSYTATFPANTGTLAELNLAQTWSAAQTFTAPVLGTPASVTLTNGTGLPVSTGISGLGTGVATFLATPSSANLAAAVTGETGTGAVVFGTSPTLTTPAISGSSSGVTTIASANAGATNFTTTLPAATDTVVELTQTQTLTNKTLTAPTLTAPVLGIPASGTLTNATGLPVAGIAAIGANTIVENATGSSASPGAVTVDSVQQALLAAVTKFTVAATGCTPSATTGGPTAGTITLAAGPCTSLVITLNGATGLTAHNGWACDVGDRTTLAAGTYIPAWYESTSSTTTATIPIPAAVGATDVIRFKCVPF